MCVAIFATVLQMQLVHFLRFRSIVNDIEGFCGCPLLSVTDNGIKGSVLVPCISQNSRCIFVQILSGFVGFMGLT